MPSEDSRDDEEHVAIERAPVRTDGRSRRALA